MKSSTAYLFYLKNDKHTIYRGDNLREINYFLEIFTPNIRNLILSNPPYIIEKITEIRLRKNNPVVVYIENSPYFISNNGPLISNPNENCFLINSGDFELIVDRLCNSSFHNNIETMLNGYITAQNGSRVGLCSSAVYKNGVLASIKDISSLNIRIAKEFKNCSRNIINEIYKDNLPSIIVASLPSMGKTTFLRDFARIISSGYKGKYTKTVIVDERNEIAGNFDTGINTDIISGFTKAKGIEAAIRTMSPEIIICDEIGTPDELEKISFGFSTGVKFAVSVHLKSAEKIMPDSVAARLIESGEFEYLIVLKKYTQEYLVYNLTEENSEGIGNFNDDFLFRLFGNYNS